MISRVGLQAQGLHKLAGIAFAGSLGHEQGLEVFQCSELAWKETVFLEQLQGLQFVGIDVSSIAGNLRSWKITLVVSGYPCFASPSGNSHLVSRLQRCPSLKSAPSTRVT